MSKPDPSGVPSTAGLSQESTDHPGAALNMADAAEMLWVVLANGTTQTQQWQDAAARWRDHYFSDAEWRAMRMALESIAVLTDARNEKNRGPATYQDIWTLARGALPRKKARQQ